jgi:hypothetical protein
MLRGEAFFGSSGICVLKFALRTLFISRGRGAFLKARSIRSLQGVRFSGFQVNLSECGGLDDGKPGKSDTGKVYRAYAMGSRLQKSPPTPAYEEVLRAN